MSEIVSETKEKKRGWQLLKTIQIKQLLSYQSYPSNATLILVIWDKYNYEDRTFLIPAEPSNPNFEQLPHKCACGCNDDENVSAQILFNGQNQFKFNTLSYNNQPYDISSDSNPAYIYVC